MEKITEILDLIMETHQLPDFPEAREELGEVVKWAAGLPTEALTLEDIESQLELAYWKDPDGDVVQAGFDIVSDVAQTIYTAVTGQEVAL